MAGADQAARQEIMRLRSTAGSANPPMPAGDAPGIDWQACSGPQEAQSIIAGLLSRQTSRTDDRDFLDITAAHLSSPGVRTLVGDRLSDFNRLISLRSDRLKQHEI
jgi:hypothetical protein